jgi:hypothetical protein
MSKLMMLAGGQVGGGDVGHLSAFVVLSAGTQSRIFKVVGSAAAPVVTELPAATTIDLTRFRRDVVDDLPRGGYGMATPDAAWVCGVVRSHLKKSEGLEVG